MHAGVGDGDGRALHVGGVEPAETRPVDHRAGGAGDAVEAFAAAIAHDGHMEAAVGLDRERNVGGRVGDDLAFVPDTVDAGMRGERAADRGENEVGQREFLPACVGVEVGAQLQQSRHLDLGREIEVRDALLHRRKAPRHGGLGRRRTRAGRGGGGRRRRGGAILRRERCRGALDVDRLDAPARAASGNAGEVEAPFPRHASRQRRGDDARRSGGCLRSGGGRHVG